MNVMKFGGTSLADARCIHLVSELVAAAITHDPHTVVVVSALGDTTDDLLQISDYAAQRDERYADLLDSLETRHRDIAAAVISPHRDSAHDQLEIWFKNLHDVIHGIFLVRECSPRTRDYVLSFGERL
ncbi:MAG: hypothetical protein KDD44_02340, partial [Bdellovibrionales bacterium]|nr:hypothetical protein [Bdellovibrionales bacterium]